MESRARISASQPRSTSFHAAWGRRWTRELSGISLPGGAEALAASSVLLTGPARAQFAAALHQVFMAGTLLAGLSVVATLFLPPVDFSAGVPAAAGEELLAAEMTNLEPQDEPVAVSK
jgi:hypothetical protein